MGTAIHKIDFLYPKRDQPDWINSINNYINPKQNDSHQTSAPMCVIARDIPYKSIYDDYSQSQQQSYKSYIKSDSESESRKSRVRQIIRTQKKILLLPASEDGPLLVNIHQTLDQDLKVKSIIEVKGKINSRKSSEISLNSNESHTILKKKRELQPSIREILADTPSKGECFKYMQKGKQAWKVQNYQKCIQYLKLGLQSCIIQHPQNNYEKGIYHRRIGANYRMLFHDDQALKHFNQSLTKFSMEPQSQILEIAAVLNNIGIIYQEENKNKQALEHFERSLKLKRQFLPENHQQIALKLSNIGFLQWSVGEHKKSIDSYAEALHINKIVYGSQHHEVAKNYYDLSMCLFGNEQYGLWLDYHCQSLKIMKKLGLIQSIDYKTWLNCFKIRMREFLAVKNHQQELVNKCLGMMALILEKEDQIQFLTQIKDDLEKL